jgi:uracil-DNA glycosylase
MTKPIVLLGESWGANEAKLGYGFVGASGVELLRMLDEAEIITLTSEDQAFISKFWNLGDPACIDAIWRLHPEVYRANVFPFHPLGNDITSLCGGKAEGVRGFPALAKSKFLRREFIPHLERLADEIIAVDPNLVIALGNTPLWALCGTTGVSKIRGTTRLSTHTAVGYKVLPTYHPAAVLRQWELRPTTILDLMKAKREAEYPEIRRPKREIWIEPTLEDVKDFYANHIIGSNQVAVDIETAGNRITCIGFSPHSGIAIVIPFDDSRRRNRSYWPSARDELEAWNVVKHILGNREVTKTFQNGLYDIAFLWRSVGIPVFGATEDTMLLSHALQPESLKGLGFLGSVFTDEGPWKNDHKNSQTIKADA